MTKKGPESLSRTGQKLGECTPDIEDMIKRLVLAVSHKFSKTRFQVTSAKLVMCR